LPPAGTNPHPPLQQLLSLAGKRALITGAGAGIGRAIAVRLAELGAELILVDIDPQNLEAVAEDLSTLDHRITCHQTDLGDRRAIDELWSGLQDTPPGILVNNAGVYPFRAFLKVDEDFYRQVMAINLDAVFWMCQHMIRARQEKGGTIVNIGSIEAILPFKHDLAPYGVSKAGVIALTRALAREHGRSGFRINVVLPGGIVTPGTKRAAREVLRFKFDPLVAGIDFARRLPIGRLGSPDEIARMVAVLASDLSSYVQGAVIAVDGGFLSA